MNVQRGLERLSLLWWGFWMLLGAALAVLCAFKPEVSDRAEMAAVGLAVVIGGYVAHRLTCWVLAGFFSPRS